MDEVTGAVTATGEIAKAASPLIENLAKLTGPLCEEMGLYFGDKVRAFREKNITKVIEGSVKKLEDNGKAVSPVSPRLLFPIFEAASVEDNPTLQDMWSGLLASASDQADAMSPSYVETLKALTPTQAVALKLIYEGGSHPALGGPYDVARRVREGLELPPDSSTVLMLMIDTFERLGLFRREYEVSPISLPPVYAGPSKAFTFPTGKAFTQSTSESRINVDVDWGLEFTYYGIDFMRACQGPGAVDAV